MLKTVHIFVETVIHLNFQDSQKEIEIFCHIINVFSVTFDQFNVSLMNKSVISLCQGRVDSIMGVQY